MLFISILAVFWDFHVFKVHTSRIDRDIMLNFTTIVHTCIIYFMEALEHFANSSINSLSDLRDSRFPLNFSSPFYIPLFFLKYTKSYISHIRADRLHRLHWGINLPSTKTPLPSLLLSLPPPLTPPALKSANCPSPSPSILVFHDTPPKNWIFQ